MKFGVFNHGGSFLHVYIRQEKTPERSYVDGAPMLSEVSEVKMVCLTFVNLYKLVLQKNHLFEFIMLLIRRFI